MSTELASAKQSQFQSLFSQFDDQLGRLSDSIDTLRVKAGVLGCDDTEEASEPMSNGNPGKITITGELENKINMLGTLSNKLSGIKRDLIDLVG